MDAYLGEVRIFIGMKQPLNWHFCDGSLLSVSNYQALFALLGTAYGGDGVSTFGIPDLRGRIPVGVGQIQGGQTYALAAKGGSEGVAVAAPNIPAHTHTYTVSNQPATVNVPTNNLLAAPKDVNNPTYTPSIYMNQVASDTTLSTFDISSAAVGPSYEGGQQHENRQPYQTLTYIICVNGIYPVTN